MPLLSPADAKHPLELSLLHHRLSTPYSEPRQKSSTFQDTFYCCCVFSFCKSLRKLINFEFRVPQKEKKEKKNNSALDYSLTISLCLLLPPPLLSPLPLNLTLPAYLQPSTSPLPPPTHTLPNPLPPSSTPTPDLLRPSSSPRNQFQFRGKSGIPQRPPPFLSR